MSTALDANFFSPVSQEIFMPTNNSKFQNPRPQQDAARSGIARELVEKKLNRAQVIMACGTGKTLTQMWATQDLLNQVEPGDQVHAKRVLVLVPTLALLKQVQDKWLEQNDAAKWGGKKLKRLCVCSDSSIGQGEIVIKPGEFTQDEFPTGTNSDDVKRFLDREDADPDSVAVVFSTYQSAGVVAEAMRMRAEGERSFDVGIFDEAHKTVGDEGKAFGLALKDHDDGGITINKRLFFTATPRVITNRSKPSASNEDYSVASMDNMAIYGPAAYTLSFAEAAREKIIVPYKIVISIIDDSPFTRANIEHDEMTMQANQHVLRLAMENYGLKKAITFHSTIKDADDFSSTFGDTGEASEIKNFHVSGKQSATNRKKSWTTSVIRPWVLSATRVV